MPSYSRTEVWTTIHTGIAIICACLPIMKPLVTRISNSATLDKIFRFSVQQRIHNIKVFSLISGSRGEWRRTRSSASTGDNDFELEHMDESCTQEQKLASSETETKVDRGSREHLEREPRTLDTLSIPIFRPLPPLASDRLSLTFDQVPLAAMV